MTNKLGMKPTDYMSDRGVWFTRSLFKEAEYRQDHQTGFDYLFTLQTVDRFDDKRGKTIPSLHRLYVEMEDTVEYTFANSYLGGWDHWLKLTSSPFFKPYLDAMRDELTLKLKSRVIEAVHEIAKDPSAKGHLEANKFLLKEGYVDTESTSNKIGRPKKTKSPSEMVTEEMDERKRIKEDMKRLGLNS